MNDSKRVGDNGKNVKLILWSRWTYQSDTHATTGIEALYFNSVQTDILEISLASVNQAQQPKEFLFTDKIDLTITVTKRLIQKITSMDQRKFK